MKVTPQQASVLENLDRVERRGRDGRASYFLDGKNCSQQIISLSVKGLIQRELSGRLTTLRSPNGFISNRWVKVDQPNA